MNTDDDKLPGETSEMIKTGNAFILSPAMKTSRQALFKCLIAPCLNQKHSNEDSDSHLEFLVSLSPPVESLDVAAVNLQSLVTVSDSVCVPLRWQVTQCPDHIHKTSEFIKTILQPNTYCPVFTLNTKTLETQHGPKFMWLPAVAWSELIHYIYLIHSELY